MAEKIALVGTGVIGRSWGIVFARAGYDVAFFDAADGVVAHALGEVDKSLADLERAEMIDCAAALRARMHPASSLEEALDGVIYVQESVKEEVSIKHAVFSAMVAVAPDDAVLASSCSAIPPSKFLEVPTPQRCLIAHPINPPHLVPCVELVPSPWTEDAAMDRADEILSGAGQSSIRLTREVEGFVVNRLQAAVMTEAVSLFARGIVSAEDIDKSMRDGLGLRWSFMGPLETMDLNADAGFASYVEMYGKAITDMGQDLRVAEPWDEDVIKRIDSERRKLVPAENHAERRAWRDRRLIALARHKDSEDVG